LRVALDAMGGDRAPKEIVKGAIEAVREGICEVVLVGRRAEIEPLLKDAPKGVAVQDAPDVIGMEESPLRALKSKPASSIAEAVRLVRDGKAEAVISAGNTGAFVGASIFLLRLLPGVKRPGVAVPFPSDNKAGICIVVDAGTNLACKPVHLLQYGLMGALYYQAAFGVQKPRVGLLNIGAESTKGTEVLRIAYSMLREAKQVNFVGNVEGHDLFRGTCEVAVCDGLVGNAILKVAEGMGEGMLRWLNRALERYLKNGGDEKVKQFVFEELNRLGNYASYGGAPLLGVGGVVVICHGRSGADAIKNACLVAKRLHEGGVNHRIIDGLAKMGFGWWRPSRWMEFFWRGREDERTQKGEDSGDRRLRS